ncbi:DNA-binding response regulator [Nakamurella silvestris]|nr:DNA-binding response regulator [Nakamurella silvestris]
MQAEGRARVVAVDPDVVLLSGLPLLLDEFDVVAGYTDARRCVDREPRADVILVEVAASDGLGSPGAMVRRLIAQGYRVCIYTSQKRPQVILGCLMAGARGVVDKSGSVEHLQQALADIVAGRIVINPVLMRLAELADRRDGVIALNDGERAVLLRYTGAAQAEVGAAMPRDRGSDEEPGTGERAAVQAIAEKFSDYLQGRTAADLEYLFGFADGDLSDWD